MSRLQLLFSIVLFSASSIPGRAEITGCGQTAERVAFSLSLEQNFGPFSEQRTTVKWDKIFVDTSDSYDPLTGEFQVPVSGTYFITLSIHKRAGLRAPYAVLKVDGQSIFIVDECCDKDDYDGSSNTAILHLTQGQKVWVDLANGRVMAVALYENTFSGFLLYPDN